MCGHACAPMMRMMTSIERADGRGRGRTVANAKEGASSILFFSRFAIAVPPFSCLCYRLCANTSSSSSSSASASVSSLPSLSLRQPVRPPPPPLPLSSFFHSFPRAALTSAFMQPGGQSVCSTDRRSRQFSSGTANAQRLICPPLPAPSFPPRGRGHTAAARL